MSSKKHRKRIKEFYQNRKEFFKSCFEAKRIASGFIELGRAIQLANVNMENFNKKYHEHTSDKIRN